MHVFFHKVCNNGRRQLAEIHDSRISIPFPASVAPIALLFVDHAINKRFICFRVEFHFLKYFYFSRKYSSLFSVFSSRIFPAPDTLYYVHLILYLIVILFVYDIKRSITLISNEYAIY